MESGLPEIGRLTLARPMIYVKRVLNVIGDETQYLDNTT